MSLGPLLLLEALVPRLLRRFFGLFFQFLACFHLLLYSLVLPFHPEFLLHGATVFLQSVEPLARHPEELVLRVLGHRVQPGEVEVRADVTSLHDGNVADRARGDVLGAITAELVQTGREEEVFAAEFALVTG